MLMRIVLEPAPIITNEELPDHFKIQMVEWYGTAIVTTFCPIILIGNLIIKWTNDFSYQGRTRILDTTAIHVHLYVQQVSHRRCFRFSLSPCIILLFIVTLEDRVNQFFGSPHGSVLTHLAVTHR